jgi:dCMP deaminase
MADQLDLSRAYLRMCKEWAKLSKAKRKQVGALIVKNGTIISDGFNGTPKGFPNKCEDTASGLTLPYVLHAESNAIAKLARSTQSSKGATLYITLEPCFECAKLIIQSGIKKVIYTEEYRLHEGKGLLLKAGVKVIHLREEDLPL